MHLEEMEGRAVKHLHSLNKVLGLISSTATNQQQQQKKKIKKWKTI
jgi:hypothetical protein